MAPKPMSQFVRDKLNLYNVEQRTEAWFKAREGRLTASDAAAAIGQNKYCTPRTLIQRKVSPDRKFTGNAATAWGIKYEPKAIAAYERCTGNVAHECGFFVHPKYNFIGGSPDGIVDSCSSLSSGGCANSVRLLEIKCPYYKTTLEPRIPDHYYPQVQMCLETLDIEACDFVQYLPPTTFAAERILILTVWRDRNWFRQQLPVIRNFMHDLEEARRMPPPPPRPPKAKKPRKLQPYLLLDA